MAMITNSYDTLDQKQTAEDAQVEAADQAHREIKSYKQQLAECVNREIVQ